MKRWMTLLLGCLLLCTACGKKELLESIALREDTTPEQMIEELSQRYDLPESMLLESAADLAALLQIKEKYLLLGCGRIAAPEDNPQQILLAQAAPGKTEKVTATLQKRLETVQRAFPGYPSAQAGRVITAGDYALLVIVTADDMVGHDRSCKGSLCHAEIWSCATQCCEPCQAGNRAALSSICGCRSQPGFRVIKVAFSFCGKGEKTECTRHCTESGVPAPLRKWWGRSISPPR